MDQEGSEQSSLMHRILNCVTCFHMMTDGFGSKIKLVRLVCLMAT